MLPNKEGAAGLAVSHNAAGGFVSSTFGWIKTFKQWSNYPNTSGNLEFLSIDGAAIPAGRRPVDLPSIKGNLDPLSLGAQDDTD